MAAGIERGYVEEGFGEVSQRVGRAFRYLLLASTLVGIVALAALLALVAYDALQPETADAGWYLTLFALFVLPSIGVGWWLRQRTPRGLVTGLIALGGPLLGLLFGSGATMLFIDVIPATTWLGYVVAVALPFAFVVALERRPGLPWAGKLVAVLLAFAGSIAVVPGVVTGLPVLPADWLIYVLTLALPAAAVVSWLTGRRWPDGEAARYGGAATFGAAVAAAFLGPLVGLTPTPAIILSLSVVVPAGLYTAVIVREDPATGRGWCFPL
ncbi:MAG: hypothetical protein U5J98_05020 [Halobacteriales archaeon]|nr:hypothetical protein [Halobacteriales archaeon]